MGRGVCGGRLSGVTGRMTPWLIASYEPGAAEVRDRATNQRVGYVLQNFHGNWTPMRDGEELSRPYRYRADAARHVWEAFRRAPR